MESHVRREGRWDVRAVGTTMLVVSILLIFPPCGAALAQPSAADESVAPPGPQVNESAPLQALPAEPQRRMRITPQGGSAGPMFVQLNARDEPERSVENQISELNQRREELVQKARQCQLELMDLGRENGPRREQLAAELQSIHEQMRGVERDLIRLDEQRRQRLEAQIAGEQEHARNLIEQMEKLRAETGEVQRRIERLNLQNRWQAEEIASALEQTRRQTRTIEERLGGYGITYQQRIEPPLRRPPLVRGTVGVEPRRTIRDLQDEVRQLRAELQAAREREEALEGRMPSSRPGSVSGTDEFEQLRLKVDALQQQVQQERAFRERPNYCDNPYSVGSVGRNWYPNWGW